MTMRTSWAAGRVRALLLAVFAGVAAIGGAQAQGQLRGPMGIGSIAATAWRRVAPSNASSSRMFSTSRT